jgi:hypothetical protein
MSEFRFTQHAEVSPTWCFLCRDYSGPFIDTHYESAATGHVYICGPTESRSGCVGQMAHLFGMLTPVEAEQLLIENTALREQVRQLEEARTVQLSYDDLLNVMTHPPKPRKESVGSGS